ncbi:hypothetical protein HDU96_006771 [Phlyctochytrium bullatum]|nr:hypothetical protein HDU96_006771 [Phlyctochytrium bullatum]
MWDAVRVAQKVLKKPVVASFGNVSASGGYYLSAGCDKIVCSPGTITGSIGVAAARPHITGKTLELLGNVHLDEIRFSEGAKNLSILHDIGSDENETLAWNRFKAYTQSIYRVFKKRVMEGRRIGEDRIEDVAGGRVWTGKQALACGLVDELGGIERSIALASKLGLLAKFGREDEAVKWLSEFRLSNPNASPSPKPPSIDNLQLDTDIQVKVYPQPRNILKRLIEGDGLEDIIGDITKAVYRAILTDIESTLRAITPKTITPNTLSIPTFARQNPFELQCRGYKVHMYPKSGREHGRSVAVGGMSLSMAYRKLRDVLSESRVRETVRYQERFERNHDKKRRKRKQAEWRKYLTHVKTQVTKAKDLSFRNYIERKTYIDI